MILTMTVSWNPTEDPHHSQQRLLFASRNSPACCKIGRACLPPGMRPCTAAPACFSIRVCPEITSNTWQHPAAYSGFSPDYRGNPTANGYIDIQVCSSRVYAAEDSSQPALLLGRGITGKIAILGFVPLFCLTRLIIQTPLIINDNRYLCRRCRRSGRPRACLCNL